MSTLGTNSTHQLWCLQLEMSNSTLFYCNVFVLEAWKHSWAVEERFLELSHICLGGISPTVRETA